MKVPELGVGISWFSELEPLLGFGELVDVIEVEPQTMWLQPDARSDSYEIDMCSLQLVQGLPGAKILHGIGFAVGGTLLPERSQLSPLLTTQAVLNAAWVSEHLSFNRARSTDGEYTTSFMLPPRQNNAGVQAAVRSILSLATELPVPFAFETGVNYLRPRSDEMPDGEFTAEVAEQADCGIILDLHNIWCNERNGRQTVEDFLRALPLDRVWEVHLAGGFERRGYWLDSHSGEIPRPLVELAGRVLPSLPNLKALIFELFPQYLPLVGLETVRTQLETVHRLWDERSRIRSTKSLTESKARRTAITGGPSPEEWEDALGALIIDRATDSSIAKELRADRGVEIVRELLEEFRASMTVEVLKLSFRLISLARGPEAFEKILASYWRENTPERFASSEAAGFAAYLASRCLDIPYLDQVLAFERAALATMLDGTSRVVRFEHDPMALLRPLAEGSLPDNPKRGSYEVEVTPPLSRSFSGETPNLER